MTKREEKIRALVSDLIRSAGCGCCRDTDGWRKAEAELGKVLRVPEYSDGSGYNFFQFRTQREGEPQ